MPASRDAGWASDSRYAPRLSSATMFPDQLPLDASPDQPPESRAPISTAAPAAPAASAAAPAARVRVAARAADCDSQLQRAVDRSGGWRGADIDVRAQRGGAEAGAEAQRFAARG